MANESALSVLKGLTQLLLDADGLYVEEGTARIVLGDLEWQEPECTRRHVALLWRDLQRSVTAEIGSALTRRVPGWNSDWQPRVVAAQPDEFEDYLDDQPTGWHAVLTARPSLAITSIASNRLLGYSTRAAAHSSAAGSRSPP